MKLYELDELIKTVCPIEGIDANGGVRFKPEASAAQKKAAQALMDEHLTAIDSTPWSTSPSLLR